MALPVRNPGMRQRHGAGRRKQWLLLEWRQPRSCISPILWAVNRFFDAHASAIPVGEFPTLVQKIEDRHRHA